MKVFEAGCNADQKHATVEGGANAVSSITIAANANEFWVLDHLTFSANETPAANTTLTIAIGSTTVFKHFLTAAGVGPIPLGALATGVKNEAVTITASAAGGTAKVNFSIVYR